MNLPNVITGLVKAQDVHDSAAYANCFAETACVFDEGKLRNGRNEIKQWIEEANEKYKTVMNPIGYIEAGAESILTAEISGTFEGSPVVLKYHFEIKNGLIQSLKVIE